MFVVVNTDMETLLQDAIGPFSSEDEAEHYAIVKFGWDADWSIAPLTKPS